MKKFLLFVFAALLMPAIVFGQTTTNQTVITGHVDTVVLAGQTACQSRIYPSLYSLCDNTQSSPMPSVGVFLTGGTPLGHGQAATIAVNGTDVASVPFDTTCNVGDILGDRDGSGNLADLGSFADAGVYAATYGSFSYVGICQGPNAGLNKLYLTVEPGYVFSSTINGNIASRERKEAR